MHLDMPRLVIAGLAGDSGKTLLSIGLARAFTGRGVGVAPYKKGPDYIDAAWLGLAAGRPGRNLDTFMMPEEGLGTSLAAATGADLVLVEGNRGLFDGLDVAGSHSTAELAKKIAAPVVLVVDVTKTTRTVAAQVLGCQMLDPALTIAGVVLNRVATRRQERLVRQAVESATGIPVLGALPRLKDGGPLPGRHLGLVTVGDHGAAEEAVARAAETVAGHVDLEALLARSARLSRPVELPEMKLSRSPVRCRAAVARDSAFCFYYPENLEALEASGAEILSFSPLEGAGLPAGSEAVYLGGGFPEVHAEALADNETLRSDLRQAARSGIPIYAECGGLMLLARELHLEGRALPMAGVLDLLVEQRTRPQGHGYVVGRVTAPTSWFPAAEVLRGHEFHYSTVVGGGDAERTVLELERGTGVGAGRDGICKESVWASYLHLHIWSAPGWAGRLTEMACGEPELRAAAGT